MTNVDGGVLSALFSFFTLTELPVGEVFVNSPGGHPLLPWKPKIVLPGSETDGIVGPLSVLLSITQRRALAELAGLTQHEVDLWSAQLSIVFFTSIKKRLEKVRRKKASSAEHLELFVYLIVLLFLSKMRSTYVLQAAEDTFQILLKGQLESTTTMTGPKMIPLTILSGNSSVNRAVSALREYVHNWSQRRERLVIWTRHWIHRLFDNTDKKYKAEACFVLGLCTLLSSMDLEPNLIGQSSCERDGLPHGEERTDLETKRICRAHVLSNGLADSGEDTNSEVLAVDALLADELRKVNPLGLGLVQYLIMTTKTPGQSNFDEKTLHQTLDHLLGRDILHRLPPGPQLQLSPKNSTVMALKRAIISDYQRGVSIGTSGDSVLGLVRNIMQELSYKPLSGAEWEGHLFIFLTCDFINGQV